jgi:hypothetical protein
MIGCPQSALEISIGSEGFQSVNAARRRFFTVRYVLSKVRTPRLTSLSRTGVELEGEN